jgi:hypothetical protein
MESNHPSGGLPRPAGFEVCPHWGSIPLVERSGRAEGTQGGMKTPRHPWGLLAHPLGDEGGERVAGALRCKRSG